ncbi:MAG TPA: glycosyltransferase family 4 protein [Methanoregulaceae archaeon]|nr:glycosyltransferase family 4 protein [Methanoregulaceae archaeon]
MKNALLVAYEYPPIGGIGIIRSLNFSKYLPAFGWHPHVLSVRNPDRFYSTLTHEPVPDGVTVHRSWNVANNLSVDEGALRRIGVRSKLIVPDAYVGWIPDTVRVGRRIVRDHDIDLVYVSVSPFSACRIGTRLKEKTGLPLVIDFRDAWTLAPNPITYVHPALRRKNERLEVEAFRAADRIVTATEGIAEQYAEKYPFAAEKLVSILNGFDCDDIPRRAEPFEKFTIAYTGFFYGAQSPHVFLQALGRIVREHLIPDDELQFLWAGRDVPRVREMIRDEGIGHVVRYLGLVPKREADELLYRSHLLFFLLGENEQVTQRRILTGKIFPYLASGRPVLALVPEGDARDLIERYSGDSYIITNGPVDEVVRAILDAYRRWKAGDQPTTMDPRTGEFRRRYNYRARTGELAAVFDSLT